jgi:HD-GYP domain-containing protein (c-di-GMP phosphodiesterase class II)
MACLDIYQAVREERPYHPARDHGEAMKILFDMADKGQIDRDIVKDMDRVLAAQIPARLPEAWAEEGSAGGSGRGVHFSPLPPEPVNS